MLLLVKVSEGKIASMRPGWQDNIKKDLKTRNMGYEIYFCDKSRAQ
jgi:hypothetical protein